jgi:hypothetical protein
MRCEDSAPTQSQSRQVLTSSEIAEPCCYRSASNSEESIRFGSIGEADGGRAPPVSGVADNQLREAREVRLLAACTEAAKAAAPWRAKSAKADKLDRA